MAIDTLVVETDFTTLDLLLWRHYKREVSGLFEDTLRRNQNLARLGVFLPIGTKVKVNAPAPEPRGRAAVKVVTLYD